MSRLMSLKCKSFRHLIDWDTFPMLSLFVWDVTCSLILDPCVGSLVCWCLWHVLKKQSWVVELAHSADSQDQRRVLKWRLKWPLWSFCTEMNPLRQSHDPKTHTTVLPCVVLDHVTVLRNSSLYLNNETMPHRVKQHKTNPFRCFGNNWSYGNYQSHALQMTVTSTCLSSSKKKYLSKFYKKEKTGTNSVTTIKIIHTIFHL